MSKPDFLPDNRPPVRPVALALDDETVAWLDQVAEATGRNRSEVAREIFRKVREASGRPAA